MHARIGLTLLAALTSGCFEDPGATPTDGGSSTGNAGNGGSADSAEASAGDSGATGDPRPDTGADSSGDSGGSSEGSTSDTGTGPGGSSESSGGTTDCAEADWAYRRTISVHNDGPAQVDYQLAVLLGHTFNYDRAEPEGEDVRFSTENSPCVPLPYWIERWNDDGASAVWIKLDLPPNGDTSVTMHYGNAAAQRDSNFEVVFPDHYITNGPAELSGTIEHDWFEVQADHLVATSPLEALTVRANAIVIRGTLTASGAGYPGGAEPWGVGQGPGGGIGTGDGGLINGAEGAGYGGRGGRPGWSSGHGGATYGTGMPGEFGSGGGASVGASAGAGGGSIHLVAERIIVAPEGEIVARGRSGDNGATDGAGGGSGGNLVLRARSVHNDGVLSVSGGPGGSAGNSHDDGGGGGGGGRMRIEYHEALSGHGDLFASGGDGGYPDYSDGLSGVIADTPVSSPISVDVGPES